MINKLKLNREKSEVLSVGSKSALDTGMSSMLDEVILPQTSRIRFGNATGHQVTLGSQITAMANSAYCQPRCYASCNPSWLGRNLPQSSMPLSHPGNAWMLRFYLNKMLQLVCFQVPAGRISSLLFSKNSTNCFHDQFKVLLITVQVFYGWDQGTPKWTSVMVPQLRIFFSGKACLAIFQLSFQRLVKTEMFRQAFNLSP